MARLQWEASCNTPARCTAARSSGVETFIVIKTSTASWHPKSSWNALRSWEQYCTRIFPMTFTTFIKKETEQEFGGKEHTPFKFNIHSYCKAPPPLSHGHFPSTAPRSVPHPLLPSNSHPAVFPWNHAPSSLLPDLLWRRATDPAPWPRCRQCLSLDHGKQTIDSVLMSLEIYHNLPKLNLTGYCIIICICIYIYWLSVSRTALWSEQNDWPHKS